MGSSKVKDNAITFLKICCSKFQGKLTTFLYHEEPIFIEIFSIAGRANNNKNIVQGLMIRPRQGSIAYCFHM